MLRSCAVVFCIVVFGAVAQDGFAQDKPIQATAVPREFKGTFEWRDAPQPYTVTLKIEKIAEKDGVLRFSGTHFYTPGNYLLHVEGIIDPKSRVLTIRESDPAQSGAITNGSFSGTLSKDLQTIDAVWSTTDTRAKGDLKVQAEKTR
jgi:hypothetical protein